MTARRGEAARSGSARGALTGPRTATRVIEIRRLERVIEIARDHDPQLIDGIMEKTT